MCPVGDIEDFVREVDIGLVIVVETLCVSTDECTQVSNSKCLRPFDHNLISGEEVERASKACANARI